MKTNAVPENNTLTPPQKKLKQARLPFKLISDVSPKLDAAPTRKRKLSVPDAEPVTKVGKLSKENDLIEDSVVISDEESKDTPTPQNEDKLSNPFVKLIDNALKKKQQKVKTSKRKGKSKSSKKQTSNAEEKATDWAECDDVEMIEVVVQIHSDDDEPDNTNKTKLTSDDNHNTKKSDDKSGCADGEVVNIDNLHQHEPDKANIPAKQTEAQNSKDSIEEIISLEDSNHSLDYKKSEFIDQEMTAAETTQIVSDDESSSKEVQEIAGKETETKTIVKPVTPKRSVRNKAKADEKSNLNASTTSSKLDDSISSDPTTPKQTRSSSVNSSQGDESLNISATTAANLTPKQLQKKLESAKKKEEREKEKQEREKKRQLEKEERAKQRQEKDEQRKRERDEKEEAKRKEKEEKEEQKKKEREEKEKIRELEKKVKEMKEEQKRKEKEDKEEQRKKEKEAREEERRKRQEALDQEKQEQELKKKKAAEAFVNFFVTKQKVEKDPTNAPVSKNSMLSSFTIKGDMRLAPTVRVDLSDEQRQALDKILEEQDGPEKTLYLKCLKDGIAKPLSSGKTWPLSERDDEVMIVEDELPPIDGAGEIVTCESAREKLRPKLLSFHENRRPPYWGTWRKKSSFVKPRRPFGQDEKQLDYEGDSDEEWEEEQEGESLDGSACGSEDEGDARDDYEVDNEVFVPHGYLSDEEATMEEDDMLSLSPETQKARLKHLEDEFESEMKKPTEKLKPRLYGLVWETKEGGKPDDCVDALWNYFGKFAMILNDPTPLLQPSNEPEEGEKKKVKKKKTQTEGEEQSPKAEKKKKSKPESKEIKKPKPEMKKTTPNQPGINSFLTKLKNA